MEQNKKTVPGKYAIVYKSTAIRNAVLKLAETDLTKNELEVFIELSELIKTIVAIDEKAICGFLIIATELIKKSGKNIDFSKYTDVDIVSDPDILELMVYFKRVIVVALMNRIDIFQINEQIDELFLNARYSQSEANNN